MSYVVTPGPIPADGSIFDPRGMIPDLVNNTDITGIDAGSFDTSEFTFISSQTDPITDPSRGFMWFKRGEGQLYIYESPQRETSDGVTGYTSIAIGVGPRVEMLMLLGNRVAKDILIYPAGAEGYYIDKWEGASRPYRVTPTAWYFNGSTGTSNSQGFMSCFITRDTGESRALGSGGMIPAVIRGFADVHVHSGVTCTPAQRAVVSQRNDPGVTEEFYWIRSSDHHSADSLCRNLGFIVGTAATEGQGLVRIYKVGCPDTLRW